MRSTSPGGGSSRPDPGEGSSRREFLRNTAAGGAVALLLPATARGATRRDGSAGSTPAPDGPGAPHDHRAGASEAPREGLFGADERRALEALADHVLPGAAALGAVDYVEALLTAFDHDPPRIHAGAPFHPEPFLPLDRVRERGWRLRVFGSRAVDDPAAAVRGPVTGLRPLLRAEARRAADLGAGDASAAWVWWRLSAEFRRSFGELVLEACLGDPVYGGNRDAGGWRAFQFAAPPLAYASQAAAHAHPSHGPAAHDHASQGAAPPAGPAGTADAGTLGPVTRACLWVMGFFSRRLVP